MFPARRTAFTLLEVLVVIGIIGLLLAILLPVAEKVRHRGYIVACANNLRQIGQAMMAYASTENDSFPRTLYDPQDVEREGWSAGTNSTTPDPFRGPHTPNDVTAAAYLLMRVEGLPPQMFICPYDDVNKFSADQAQISSHSNFTDYKVNLGYSFADMYPSDGAARAGYKWTNKLNAEFAVAADLNPGPGTDPAHNELTAVTPTSPSSERIRGNSRNHESEGQNVLYGDGHVVFQTTCLCGIQGDNIYINANGRVEKSPIGPQDSLLVPTDLR